VETELALDRVRPNAAERPNAALEYPRSIVVLLLAAIAGVQVTWLAALGLLIYWLA
jgi:hypothetical protein